MLDSIANLISAIARLAWPILALTLIIMFRHNVRGLFNRVYRASFLGSEFEFKREQLRDNVEKIDELHTTIKSARSPPAATSTTSTNPRIADLNQRRIIEELDINALRHRIDEDPAYAIVLISGAIESALRRTLAGYDVKPDRRGVRQVARDARQFGYGDDFQEAIARFSNIRNMIVHGQDTFEQTDLREVAHLGLRILEYIALREAQPIFVDRVGLPIYEDPACGKLIAGLEGIVLVYRAIPGATGTQVVAATPRRGYYHSGEEVLPAWAPVFDRKVVFTPDAENLGISFLDLEEHGLFDGKQASDFL